MIRSLHSRLLGLLLVACCSASVLASMEARAEISGNVAAGETSAAIKDGFAQVSDVFGKKWVRAFFFTAPVAEEIKKRLAARESSLPEHYREYGIPIPAFELIFIYGAGATNCEPVGYSSYTAVFNKSVGLPLPLNKEVPLNIPRVGRQGAFYEGIKQLQCASFRDGERLLLDVRGNFTASAQQFPGIFNLTVSSLDFQWSVAGNLPLYDQAQQRNAVVDLMGSSSVSTADVKDTLVVYSPSLKWLSFAALGAPASEEDKNNADRRKVLFRQALITFNFRVREASSKIDKGNISSMSLYVPVPGKKILSMVDGTDITGNYHLSGDLKEGGTITASLKGAAVPSVSAGRPAVAWNLSLTGTVRMQQ